MNTINVNYMTRTYNNFIKSQQTGRASGRSMADTMAEKLSESGRAGEAMGTANARAISTKDMTMDEYKQYIHDKISGIHLHPSRRQDNIAINISEAGFEAMKNDPEYEKWVLDEIKTDFSFNDPWAGYCGGSYEILNIGATKEECNGISWYKGCFGANDEREYGARKKDCFWERKAKRKREMEIQAKKQREKKRLQQAEYEKAVMQRRFVL